jgi:hypothetical protein
MENNTLKILFLDNDGVICLSNNWGSRYKKQSEWGGRKLSMDANQIPLEYRFDDFDKKAIQVLNEILEKTGAEIVVSSDWRGFATLEELGEYYTNQGIIKKPIGVTKFLGECEQPKDFPWSYINDREQCRSLEILQYLKDYPEITHWVAVDDLSMGVHVENSSYGAFDRDWGLTNFVWTPYDTEGIKQSGIKEKIIKYLNNGK